MMLLQQTKLEEIEDCPYLSGRVKQYEYFLAGEVSAQEISRLLAEGWRKFGLYFFRPACPGCRLCLPLRVEVETFRPSRSQRRVLRRDQDLEIRFGPLRPDDRIYDLYRRHSLERFGQETDREMFVYQFYLPSCPALQSEIYLEGELIGVGFLDRGSDSLSSVYFCFDPEHDERQLGTLSILAEIDHARKLGLPWYYLGYFVPGCSRMAYKDHFRPRQTFDWKEGTWRKVTGPPGSWG